MSKEKQRENPNSRFNLEFKGMKVIVLHGKAALDPSVTRYVVEEGNSRNALATLKSLPDKMKISQEGYELHLLLRALRLGPPRYGGEICLGCCRATL